MCGTDRLSNPNSKCDTNWRSVIKSFRLADSAAQREPHCHSIICTFCLSVSRAVLGAVESTDYSAFAVHTSVFSPIIWTVAECSPDSSPIIATILYPDIFSE